MSQELNDERISAYLDGELAQSERAEMEELLRTGGAHQQMLAELTSLRESLQSLPRYSLGSEFADRVVAAARRAADKTGVSSANPTVTVKKDQSVIPLSRPERRWLLGLVGGLVATAACVGLMIYALSGTGENVGKLEAEGGNKKNPSIAIEQPASKFVQAIAGSKESEAVVIRVRLTKEAIRNKRLDESLKANGILVADANLSNEAARNTAESYKTFVKSQASSSAARRGAGDVLFVEADAARLEKALLQLANDPSAKASFAAESLVASAGKGPALGTKVEGEPGSVGEKAKVPTGDYAQHLGPRGFLLPDAVSPPAATSKENVPPRKSSRVLIVVEVAD